MLIIKLFLFWTVYFSRSRDTFFNLKNRYSFKGSNKWRIVYLTVGNLPVSFERNNELWHYIILSCRLMLADVTALQLTSYSEQFIINFDEAHGKWADKKLIISGRVHTAVSERCHLTFVLVMSTTDVFQLQIGYQ